MSGGFQQFGRGALFPWKKGVSLGLLLLKGFPLRLGNQSAAWNLTADRGLSERFLLRSPLNLEGGLSHLLFPMGLSQSRYPQGGCCWFPFKSRPKKDTRYYAMLFFFLSWYFLEIRPSSRVGFFGKPFLEVREKTKEQNHEKPPILQIGVQMGKTQGNATNFGGPSQKKKKTNDAPRWVQKKHETNKKQANYQQQVTNLALKQKTNFLRMGQWIFAEAAWTLFVRADLQAQVLLGCRLQGPEGASQLGPPGWVDMFGRISMMSCLI